MGGPFCTPFARASTTARLAVTVLAENDAPRADDARLTVALGGSLRIDLARLVGDVECAALTLTPVAPEHGTLARNADGTWTYTPRRAVGARLAAFIPVGCGSLSSQHRRWDAGAG